MDFALIAGDHKVLVDVAFGETIELPLIGLIYFSEFFRGASERLLSLDVS